MNTDQITKTEKTVHWVGYITLAIGMYFLIQYLWATLFPVKVLDIKKTTWEVQTKNVIAGEEVTFLIDFCKVKDYESHVTKNLIGEQGVYILPSSNARFPIGCRVISQSHIIPKSVPSGKYHVEIHISYTINQYRTVDYHFQTEPFMVTNPVLNGEE